MITRDKANDILDSFFQTIAGDNNSIVYIGLGLSSSVPDETGGGFSQPAGETGYKKVALTVMGSANNGQITNDDIIFFPESKKDWGDLGYFGLFKGSASKPFFWGELNPHVEVKAEHIPIFRKNKLVIGIDKDPLDPYPES